MLCVCVFVCVCCVCFLFYRWLVEKLSEDVVASFVVHLSSRNDLVGIHDSFGETNHARTGLCVSIYPIRCEKVRGQTFVV